jgi:hypothetical protein
VDALLLGRGEGERVAETTEIKAGCEELSVVQAVRVLNIMAPAGFENYFCEAAGALPDNGPPDPEVLARIAVKHDFRPAG